MNTIENAKEWYVLRGEEKFGPFEYGAMIHMLQKNELYDYNFVWAPHMDAWAPLGEVADFSKDRLARLIEKKVDVGGAFITRSCPRAAVEIPVYAHDSRQFFDGTALSVSANGGLLLLNTPMLLPDQDILIHFRATENGHAAFNVRASIVRKNFTRSRINVKSGLHYAVRFSEVSGSGQDVLKTLVKEYSKGVA